MHSLSQQLTTQFYQWELLGKGWLLSKELVQLEAPFTPFFGHFVWQEKQYNDDGLKPTRFNKILSALTKTKQVKTEYAASNISYEPFLFDDNELLTTLQITLQKGLQFSQAQTEQFLSMLSFCTKPISFELVGTSEKITIQLTSRESDTAYVQTQLESYFPSLGITESEDVFKSIVDFNAFATVDFGLEQEFIRPLPSHHSLDSLTGVFSLLENLSGDQKLIFQVLFNGLINKWENSIVRSASDESGSCFFKDAPEMLSLAKQKISKPLLTASIRSIVFADTLEEAYELLEKVGFVIQKTYSSQSNSLIHLSDAEYTATERCIDIFFRTSHRLGMLLNIEELASIVHFPSASLISRKLLIDFRKTKLAPLCTEEHTFSIGINKHQGEEKEVTLLPSHRLKHTHIIGATGTGKSTLLLSMIAQDIEMNNGVAVLDPHGDLIEAVLCIIPEKRIKDVVIIDPSDSEYPVGFNILQAHSEIEKETLCSDLVAAFKRLSTSWGDQMHSILSNAILAFLEGSKGGTLLDLRRFLLEPSFRNDFLKTVEDYSIHYYWQKQYPLLKSGSIGPILTRLDNFLRSRLIRNMVAQKHGIDFEHLLDTQKIVLIKLSQGLIGEENSFLLGSFIVSKIHQAALARQAKEQRKDFFLYIDEFQHFITPSMADLLSGARKYHLGLILAHQDLVQLQKGDNGLSSSLFANAGTRICFRVAEADAKKLSEGFSYFETQDLQNLNTGEAIARVEKPENDFSLITIPLQHTHNSFKEQIISHSRTLYTKPKEIVEKHLANSFHNEYTYQKEESIKIRNTKDDSISVNKIKMEETAFEQNIEIPAPPRSFEVSDEKVKEATRNLLMKKAQTQHRYIQNLIKQTGEAKGFKATIEAPLKNNTGKVDVLLENGIQTIACEVCVTTDTSWEIHNLQKCINTGYDKVLSCVTDVKAVAMMQQKIEQSFSKEEIAKIKVMQVEELLFYLDTLTSTPELKKEMKLKGYRVSVSHSAISGEEQQQKKAMVARIVGQSLQKMTK